jgi:hypothetical protein
MKVHVKKLATDHSSYKSARPRGTIYLETEAFTHLGAKFRHENSAAQLLVLKIEFRPARADVVNDAPFVLRRCDTALTSCKVKRLSSSL